MSSTPNPWLEYKQAILNARSDFSWAYADLKGVKPSTNGWVSAQCPFHDDKSPSFAFDRMTGNWKCHAGCGEGTVFDFVSRVTDRPFKDSMLAIGDELGVPRPVRSPDPKVTYDYHGIDGNLKFQVVKGPGKKFWQRRPDGKGGWIKNIRGVKPVLYRLSDLIAQPDDRVYIVEGEKDADRLAGLGLLATTNPGGAGKWKPAFSDTLADRDIVILPDNDAPGRAHAEQIIESFGGDVKSVKIVELPGLPDKGDVSDWLDAGGTETDLEALVDAAAPYCLVDEGTTVGPRPTIMISGRQMDKIIGDAWSAIHSTNDPPHIFLSSGLLARLTQTEGVPAIQLLDEHSAYGVLIRTADWLKNSGTEIVDAEPKRTYAHDILSNPDPNLPPLDSVITTPVFDNDWRLITKPGYHPEAELWYHAGRNADSFDVPIKPTADEVEAARSLIIDDLLFDFPFAADSDRAHAVAALLLPFARRMFDGPTPMHLIEAPTPGSGKSLLAELISIVALGISPGCTTLTNNEEESRKKLTAILSRGASIISIDNLKGGLWSAQVAAAITAEIWEDRILGKTQMVTFPNRAMWLVSANNPKLSMEIARRCVRVRIDPGEEQPWKRTGFKHDPIREWAKQNRQRLVQAVLTLIQHWVASGAPHAQETLGSFEAWSRVVGGMVAHIGLQGFLGDTDEFYAAADSESQEWKAFIVAWQDTFYSHPVKTNQLLKLAEDHDLISFAVAGQSPQAQRVKLAKALTTIRGRRFGDVVVEASTNTHSKTREYRLVEIVKDQLSSSEVSQ